MPLDTPNSPSSTPSTPTTASIALAAAIIGALGGYYLSQASSLGLFGGGGGGRSNRMSKSSNSSKSNGKNGKNGKNTTSKDAASSWPNSYNVKVYVDSSDEEEQLRRQKREVDVLKRKDLHSRSSLDDGGERNRGVDEDADGKGNANGDEDEDEDENEDEDKDDEDEDKDDEDDSNSDSSSGLGADGTAELDDYAGNVEECKLVLVVRTDLGMGKGKIAAQASHATLACYTYMQARAPQSTLLQRWQHLGQTKVAVACQSEDEILTLQAQAMSVGLCARVIRDAGRTQIAAGSVTVLGVGPGPKSVVDGITGRLKLL